MEDPCWKGQEHTNFRPKRDASSNSPNSEYVFPCPLLHGSRATRRASTARRLKLSSQSSGEASCSTAESSKRSSDRPSPPPNLPSPDPQNPPRPPQFGHFLPWVSSAKCKAGKLCRRRTELWHSNMRKKQGSSVSMCEIYQSEPTSFSLLAAASTSSASARKALCPSK